MIIVSKLLDYNPDLHKSKYIICNYSIYIKSYSDLKYPSFSILAYNLSYKNTNIEYVYLSMLINPSFTMLSNPIFTQTNIVLLLLGIEVLDEVEDQVVHVIGHPVVSENRSDVLD